MNAKRRPVLIRRGLRLAASLGAVAAVTGVIFLLREGIPVLSLGVLYVFAVLPVAVVWGRPYAILTAVASMLAFNFFFLPPRHTLQLEEGGNWFALAVYLATALVVSDLAARARRRAAEAEQREREEALLAELSIALLHGRDVARELDRAGPMVADAIGAERARLELGPEREPRPGETAQPLTVGDRHVGVLHTEPEPDPAMADRLLPALASLLAVSVDREQLQREALEAESLRISDSIKTAILRAVSHDLRSPLTAIRLAAESLASPSVQLTEDDRRRQLETVQAESRRLDRLVANLLDLSRLEAGAAKPERELVGADELVGQALAQLPDEGRVDVSLPPEIPVVEVDPIQVERTLVNLLENALSFTPAGERVLVAVSTSGRNVIIDVLDSGPGLDEHELKRVFEPFVQLDRGERGAGLGLAIARGFAEANGGRIWAESRPGGGARFAVAFPLARIAVKAEP